MISVSKRSRCTEVIKSLIRVYQRWVSPLIPTSCRFYPTCSEYAKQCFERFPLIKATTLTLLRLARCHPYCEGGIDPVHNPCLK